MILKLIHRSIAKVRYRNSLGGVLTIPIVLQTLVVVGVTGYFSLLNGQQVVKELVEQLLHETSDRIDLYLKNYLAQPQTINKINADAVRLGQIDLDDLAKLETHLATQVNQFSAISSIAYGDNLGNFRSVTKTDTGLRLESANKTTPQVLYRYGINKNGNRGELETQLYLPTPERGIFDRPWYQAALANQQLSWNPLFQQQNSRGNEFTLNASAPAYDSQGKLRGAFAISLDLAQISAFLSEFSGVKDGEIFIVERSGLLVATSDPDKPFRWNPDGTLERIGAKDSSNALIRATAQYLQAEDPHWQKMQSPQNLQFFWSRSLSFWGKLHQDRYFVRAIPFRDSPHLDWLVVIVVPESSFTAQVQQNTYITMIFCLIALVIGLSGGVWTTRWLVEPLARLNRAVKAISQGDFYYPVQIDRLDEVGELAQSFNHMAFKLRTSFEELRESNDKFRRLAENIPGITYRYVFHPDGSDEFTYLSPQLQEFYELAPEVAIADINLLWQKIFPEDADRFRQSILDSSHNLTAFSLEYRVLRRGEMYWHQAFSTPELQPNGDVIWDGVIIDITEQQAALEKRQQAEELLANHNQILEQEVAQQMKELSQANLLLEREVRQRTAIEKSLAESEARLQDILNTADASIILLKVSPVTDFSDYKPETIYLSQGHETVFGYSPEETIATKGLWRSRVHPEDTSKTFYPQMEKICTLGRAVLEYRFYHRDGKIRWISDNVTSRWDATAQCWFITAIAIDITDRKLAEAERLSQQVFLRQIIDLVPAHIFVKDLEGHYLAVNQATANRYQTTVEAMQGKTSADFNPNLAEVADYRNNNQEVISSNQIKTTPARQHWSASGDPAWYQEIISPFIDTQGQVQGIVGIAIDVTNIKQVEEELRYAKDVAEAANRAKSLFLAKMSHELRTPLNAILGFSKIMQNDRNLTPNQRSNLGIISESGDHLLFLINQVLDLSKIEAQQMVLHQQNCDIYTLLREIQKTFSLKARDQGLWLVCNHTPDTPRYIYTDEVKLRQVLLNLLSNGLKFTKVGGVSLQVSYQPTLPPADTLERINLRRSPQTLPDQPTLSPTNNLASMGTTATTARIDSLLQGSLVFSITDTGVGIDPQKFDRLFQPFNQATSDQQFQEGTGLGLHLSWQFVQLLGGEITVHSQVGQGSTFKFALPVPLVSFPLTNSPRHFSNNSAHDSSVYSLDDFSHTLPDPSNFEEEAIRKASPTVPEKSGIELTENSLGYEEDISVPEAWLTNFQEVIIEGDMIVLRSILQEISATHPRLFQTLSHLANQYRLEELLALAQSLVSQ